MTTYEVEINGEETLFIDASDQLEAVEIARQRTGCPTATYHVHHHEEDSDE